MTSVNAVKATDTMESFVKLFPPLPHVSLLLEIKLGVMY